MWAAVVSVLAGCGIVLLALLDVVATALHPSAASVLSARFHRLIWFLVRHLARLLPVAARPALLSWTLPLSIAGLVFSWLLALLVGFGLIDAPWMGRPRAFHTTGPPLTWVDAFYFSGICLSTQGFGDIVPQQGIFRALAVAEGLSGLTVIGGAITYVLAVFPVLPGATVLATTLNEETNGQVDALPLVRRYLVVAAAEPLAQRCRDLATQLLMLSEAHTTHPVLFYAFYAHPRQVERSFLRRLVVMQRLVALLRYGLPRSDHAGLVQDPRVVGLEETLIGVLRQLGASMHLLVQPPAPEAAERLRQDYRTLVSALHEAGLRREAPVQHREQHREQQAYVRFRRVTDPYIDAYAANSGYAAEDVWGPHPPLRGTTAPIPIIEDDETPSSSSRTTRARASSAERPALWPAG